MYAYDADTGMVLDRLTRIHQGLPHASLGGRVAPALARGRIYLLENGDGDNRAGTVSVPGRREQFSFCQFGRARHSVRAGLRTPASERRARSDTPYPATHPHTENCWVAADTAGKVYNSSGILYFPAGMARLILRFITV
jgi:hypothetical protein